MSFIFRMFLVIGLITIIGLLIYFIVKRVDDKEKETFEKRDN